VSWLFHFTNRSVYYGWCQDDQSSRKKFVKTQRVLKIQISSYQKAEISSKISNQLAQGLVYTVQFRLLLAEKNEMRKGKRNLWSENVSLVIWLFIKTFLVTLGYFGIRRLAAEEG